MTCTICRNPKVAEINAALLETRPTRTIAHEFGVSRDALNRHRKAHLPATLVKAHEAAEEMQAGTLLDRLRAVNEETLAVLAEAKRARDGGLRLKALQRMEQQIRLEGELLGELQQQGVAVAVQVGMPRPPEHLVTEAAIEQVAALVLAMRADCPEIASGVEQWLWSRWRERREAMVEQALRRVDGVFPAAVYLAGAPVAEPSPPDASSGP